MVPVAIRIVETGRILPIREKVVNKGIIVTGIILGLTKMEMVTTHRTTKPHLLNPRDLHHQ
jgi:hypothetical protein